MITARRIIEAVEEAERIPGWMSPAELQWLAEQALEHDLIVEVGSWQGRSTKVLAALTPGIVYSVDNLAGEADAPVEDLDALFRQNLAEEIEGGKLSILRGDSVSIADHFLHQADMVFIDGSHVAPHPAADIEAWGKVLTRDGLLCGHDCFLPGVAEALEDWEWTQAASSIWTIP